MRTVKVLGLALLMAWGVQSQAYEVSGVQLDEQVTIQSGAPVLQLQGAGVRTKFFIDIYVGALYTENKVESTKDAIQDTGAKRMQMSFVYENVNKEKLRKSWQEGMDLNNSRALLKQYKTQIHDFIALFDEDMHAGETLTVDYQPKVGITVSMKGKIKGVIADQGFFPIVLNTWMGRKPPSKNFQQALLTIS